MQLAFRVGKEVGHPIANSAAGWDVAQHHGDFHFVVGQFIKGNLPAGLDVAVGAAPGHPFIFFQAGGLGVPLNTAIERPFHHPVAGAVTGFGDGADMLHKVGEVLEVGPCLVDSSDGRLDNNVFGGDRPVTIERR